jgi:hypothetical protein
MVFHYTIRGGPCRHSHSHIQLTSDDITCFVGRDKHENEFLIKYGWLGDVWFHVEGLSSAHVYFRVTSERLPVDGIPMDDLPEDAVYDMMQIVKHNSIAGSKLASCKIVWTPHSNLKKTFEMDSGTVTYHDTKICRYGRCDKDRQRIKELEKTKRERHNVNYYEEMKANERRIMERRKRERKNKVDDVMYDPIEDDLRGAKLKAGRQGDALSGIDTGLAALEGLAFGEESISYVGPDDNMESRPASDMESNNNPIWMNEAESRSLESSETIQFLRARGYTAEEASSVADSATSSVDALAQLWRLAAGVDASPAAENPDEEIQEAQNEESEVLRAIFGEDDEGVQFSDDESKFDAILPVTSYEPPQRYGLPPPLLLEIYVDNGISPAYPKEPPVLALTGGGLPQVWLRELTSRLRTRAVELSVEEPGEPQIFNLVGFLGEVVDEIVKAETAELDAQARLKKKQAQEAARRNESEAEKRQQDDVFLQGTKFSTEAERRAYAKAMIEGAGHSAPTQPKAAPSQPTHFKTGVSDKSLIEDLFG